jgi:hypothetical protein
MPREARQESRGGYGLHLYAMKVIGIFVNMESAFGKHIESGLKNLKSVTEN